MAVTIIARLKLVMFVVDDWMYEERTDTLFFSDKTCTSHRKGIT